MFTYPAIPLPQVTEARMTEVARRAAAVKRGERLETREEGEGDRCCMFGARSFDFNSTRQQSMAASLKRIDRTP